MQNYGWLITLAGTLVAIGVFYGRIDEKLSRIEKIVFNGHFATKEEINFLEKLVYKVEARLDEVANHE